MQAKYFRRDYRPVFIGMKNNGLAEEHVANDIENTGIVTIMLLYV